MSTEVVHVTPEPCPAVLSWGSRYIDPEPPELCGEPVNIGDEFCPCHGEDDLL